jgi:hypothetical protein
MVDWTLMVPSSVAAALADFSGVQLRGADGLEVCVSSQSAGDVNAA